MFGLRAFGIWIVYATILIVLTETGGNIIEWHKDMTLKRLSKSVSFESLKTDAEAVERMLRNEFISYASLPLGLLLGTIVGLIRHQMLYTIILSCFLFVLFLASLTLLYFLVVGFQRMCDPLYRTGSVSSPEIVIKKPKGFLPKGLSKVLEIVVPPAKQKEQEDQEQKDLDLACDVSELRRVYKYDALLNSILFIVLIAMIINMQGIIVNTIWLILGLLASAFLLSELPYGIGQYFLHNKVLERYTGAKHAEMKKKLDEYAPLFPPWTLLAALTTAATIGGFLFFLLNLFVQSGLNIIGK